jgi:hypothetical protein
MPKAHKILTYNQLYIEAFKRKLCGSVNYNSFTIQIVQAKWPELPNALSNGL